MNRLAAVGKLVVVLFAINFAAIAVVAAVLALNGTLTPSRVAAAVEALRGPPEALEPVSESAASQPAVPPPPMSLADRARATALVRAELDREIEEARQRARLVEQERERLERDRAAFEAERQAFLQSLDADVQARREAGLAQALKTYKALKPTRIKELIQDLPDAEVAAVLTGLEPRLAGKVIDEFQSPEELQRIRKVMDLIRQGAATATGQTGASL